MKRHIYLDYNSISLRLDAMMDDMRDNFDSIVILLRGGSFAGMHVAFHTAKPYYFLKYDRSHKGVSWIGEPPPLNSRILLSEDFAGKGNTLLDCMTFLSDHNYTFSTLVVCKDTLSASTPDYYCFDCQDGNARFVLPWERYLINNRGFTEPGADFEFERTAWDLDGVFLEDVDSSVYAAGLEEALLLRDRSLLASYKPSPAPYDMIITGRPEVDKERTEKWLKENEVHIPVQFRDDEIEKPTPEETAKWKGKRAIELGFTHFVESDARQAAHIASFYPELRVTWWNEGTPIAIQAAKQVKDTTA